MKYYLRQAKATDFDFLYRLKVVCLKKYVAAIWGWDDDFQRSHFAAHFDPAGSHIVVVYGRDAGQLSVMDRSEERYLSGIYLLPAYQGQGLGGQIIGDVLAGARDSNRPVRLQVLKGNPAGRLYERLGFSEVGRTQSHILMRSD